MSSMDTLNSLLKTILKSGAYTSSQLKKSPDVQMEDIKHYLKPKSTQNVLHRRKRSSESNEWWKRAKNDVSPIQSDLDEISERTKLQADYAKSLEKHAVHANRRTRSESSLMSRQEADKRDALNLFVCS
jgi:hypothetical protein